MSRSIDAAPGRARRADAVDRHLPLTAEAGLSQYDALLGASDVGHLNSEGTICAIRNEKGHGIVRLESFSIQMPLFGEQIAGWMGEAILLSGKKDVQAAVTQTPSGERDYFEFELTWTP